MEPGTKLREYTIIGKLGEGGMGVVYEATHDFMPGQTVALKVMASLLTDAESRLRFLNEIAIATTLRHPNILLSYPPLLEGEQVVWPMEKLVGPTLGRWRAGRCRPTRRWR